LLDADEVALRKEYIVSELPIATMYVVRERARRADRDSVISLVRDVVDDLALSGQLALWGAPASGVLVDLLLDRGDVAEAASAIERLAAVPADEGLAVRDIWLVRLQAVLARFQGDGATYIDLRDRYHQMAKSLGFEGHIGWAEMMR
jgi:hypothetical protein